MSRTLEKQPLGGLSGGLVVLARDKRNLLCDSSQPLRVSLDDLEIVALCGSKVAGFPCEEGLEVAEDRRQRRPQLMREQHKRRNGEIEFRYLRTVFSGIHSGY
jgi:hypothetical protein